MLQVITHTRTVQLITLHPNIVRESVERGIIFNILKPQNSNSEDILVAFCVSGIVFHSGSTQAHRCQLLQTNLGK